jgi:hypothetical protein
MTQAIAENAIGQETLEKARYFLSQAKLAEQSSSVLTYRLPFSANLEAAIIYARASIEHLKAEFAPKYNSRGYRGWHDDAWNRFRASDKAFEYFYDRRNFILHQEPEATTAHVNLEARTSIRTSVSVSMVIKRANGTIETINDQGPSGQSSQSSAAARISKEDPPQPSTRSQHFLFADDDWRVKPAQAYVEDFIDSCLRFLTEAENKFR